MTENEQTRGEELFTKALDWCVDQAETEEGATICPFCGWRSEITKRGSTKPGLKSHMRGKHPANVTVAFMHKDINALEKINDEEKVEANDLELTKEGAEVMSNPYFNQLYVPEVTKKRWRANGIEGRWARRDRVQGYKDMGYNVSKRPNDADMPLQHSTEDSTMQANEMVLVEAPARLVAARKEFKEQQVDQQLIARKEELERSLSSNAREVYDTAMKRGLGKEQARNLAEAAERGGLRISRG